jgi:hypothetical protein
MADDIQKLIGEIATRNHILVDRDDPVFAVSTINRYMLDEATERLFERVRVLIKEFEISARAVETHAGQMLAEEMRTSTSALKAEIAKDVNIANARCCEMIDRIHRAHSESAIRRWVAIGALAGLGACLVFLACGFLLGNYFPVFR